MQTFLPYPNFACSAQCLDNKRLNQQANETRQILIAIRNGGGWRHHPAVLQWRDHVPALRLYHDVILREWIVRGRNNTRDMMEPAASTIVMPPWLGDERYHSSHRAALLFKEPRWYSQFGWDEIPELNYHWPVRIDR